ncbi:putative transcriptional regulator SLK1 [Hibiscus syriacus]|uniref:Transcriptional regulator SLK1 n=1 Tax=Hibiscus syriacus TaxID=106335 RepID=A0A6A3DBL3_HIBSY|nr:probable transcriptional regulator SLK2 [Hibiscus syriacus]KAE8736449.1 putative transcriptional regulator SLK1 [Hibiscus syriacus]
MVPSRVAGGLTRSSSRSGIFFQGDGQSQAVFNSRLSYPYENSSNSIPGTGRPNMGLVSGDMNSLLLNSVANSGHSAGASSLVTDANSALSGGSQLQRSASFNTDSYTRLPASPMSFSSYNINMSGSSVVDGSSAGQQGSHQDPSVRQLEQSQLLQQGASSAISLSASQTGQVSLPMSPRVQGSFVQDPNNLSQVQKKPRLDIKHEDILQQQVLQQLLQRQDSMQLQGRNPQLQALVQQQRLRQQQQILRSMPPLQRVQFQQQQQQVHLRQQLQQQGMQQVAGMKRSFDGGVCARRLMQYLYHQRQRPTDNTFAYWRKFVSEYYSPRAKKRWCLSLYDNVGSHALGVFPQAAMDAWHCDICGSKSGRGFEATFEVLPRLNEIKFGSVVVDELLFLDLPRECRFPSGIMMLEYGKVVQESVYEQLRVVREGQLRIIFTQDLKILSWEFCARRHEELFPRRLVAPQVNQLLQVAQKCQSTISAGGSEGVSQQDLQTNSNMVLTAGRQLVKSLELQSLNDLGFSKRYVRCLQIAEVVSSMKDLIDFCREHKVGPIDGLKNYPRHAGAAKLQMQETEQLSNTQGLPNYRNTLHKLMALHPGINNPMGNSQHMDGRGTLSGSAQAALALSNYQNMLSRQNSMISNPNSLNQEASSSFNNSNQRPSSNFQEPAAVLSGSMQTLPVSGLLSPHLPTQQQQQQLTVSGNNIIQKNHPQQSQGNQVLQQQMMQQLYHEMSNNNTRVQQQQLQSLSGQNGNASGGRNGMGFGSNTTAQPGAATSNVSGSAAGPAPSRSNSFKGASNSDSSAAGGHAGFNRNASDLPQSLHLQDDIVSDIAQEFLDSGFFNSELDDYGWQA